jgi:hypothetical protein
MTSALPGYPLRVWIIAAINVITRVADGGQ